MRIAVVTMKTIGDAVPGEYANKLLDDVYNDGQKGNMVLLQVTNTRKWYIATDKQLKQVIVGNEGIEYMSKPMVAEFKEKMIMPKATLPMLKKQASSLSITKRKASRGILMQASTGLL